MQGNFPFGDESVRKWPESRVGGATLPRATPPRSGSLPEGKQAPLGLRRGWGGRRQ